VTTATVELIEGLSDASLRGPRGSSRRSHTLSVRLARLAVELDGLAQQLAAESLNAADGDLLAPAAHHLELAVETIGQTLYEVAKWGRAPAEERARARGPFTPEDIAALVEAERTAA
jgi:hypothetical protein